MELSPLYHNTRPEGELLPQEEAAFALLEELGMDYDRVSGEPADTMEKCAAVSAVLGVPICKIGSARLSFAPEENLWELLHCTPGSATVLGLMNDRSHRVRLLMEREVYEAEYLSCHPCICTSSLKLKTADVLRRLLPHTGHEATVVEL